MATPISTDNSVYFTNFETGNDFTPSTYFQYARDMDDNFKALRTTVNQVVAEVNAVNGPSALIARDMLLVNDTAGPVGQVLVGVIGEHSYKTTINGGDASLLDVAVGQCMVSGGQRTELPFAVQLDGTPLGGATTAYVAVDANGAVSLESASGQQEFDVVSAVWNGTIFTSVTQLAEIFFDGDDYRQMRVRPVNGDWTAKTFRNVGIRIEAIERAVAGISTDSEGTAVSGLGFSGSAANPGLAITDGTTRDNTGWYRVGADSMGVSVAGVQRARWVAQGLVMNQDGDASNPIIADSSDLDKGIYFTGVGTAITMDGAQQFEVVADQVRCAVGDVTNPGISFIGDTTAGIRRVAAGSIALNTDSTDVLVVDTNQNVDLPVQPRFRAENATESLSSSALVLGNISFDAADEVFDVGAWHTGTSADFTVPTATAASIYEFELAVTFDETGTGANTGQRVIAIQVNGNDKALVQIEATSANETRLFTKVRIDATATNVIRARAAQNSGDTMNITDIEFSGQKVA